MNKVRKLSMLIMLLFSTRVYSYGSSSSCQALFAEANSSILNSLSMSFQQRRALRAIYDRRLESFVEEGDRVFPNGISGFQENGIFNREFLGAQGTISKLAHKGQSYILKMLTHMNPLKEIRSAQALKALGVGPEAYLLGFSYHPDYPQYALVLKEVGGVNSRPLIWIAENLNNPSKLSERKVFSSTISAYQHEIELILGKDFSSPQQAFQAYAKAIVDDPLLIARMREIGRTLDLHYSDYFDFQMMILPRVNERTAEVNVIDAGANMRWSSNLVARGFQRLYRRQQQAYRPSQLVESLITRLERVALE